MRADIPTRGYLLFPHPLICTEKDFPQDITKKIYPINIYVLTSAEFCATILLFTKCGQPRGGVAPLTHFREWAVGASPVVKE